MPIQIVHRFICGICSETTESRPITYIPIDTLPIPHIPEGWKQIDGLLVCPKHEAKRILFVDGKEITL